METKYKLIIFDSSQSEPYELDEVKDIKATNIEDARKEACHCVKARFANDRSAMGEAALVEVVEWLPVPQWRAEEEEKERRRDRERKEAKRRKKEENERAEYERLRAKYGEK